MAIARRERTPEGFLRATAALTRTGVQRYSSEELGLPGPSREVGIYRPPETVFSDDTKASARMKPVTVGHPAHDVTPANYRNLAVGHLGDEPFAIDDRRLGASLTLTDADTIAQVEQGKDQISAGYYMNVLPERGTFDGLDYDYRVDGPMRINHVALVDRGRAGPSVRIFDGDKPMDEAKIKQLIADAISKATVKTDGGPAKAIDPAAIADAVAQALAPAVAEAIQTADQARAEAEKKAADEKAAKDKANADMRQAADRRARLIVDCLPLLGKDARPHEMTDRQILEAALGDSVPDAKDRSDDYLGGVLDVMLSSRNEAAKQRGDGTKPIPGHDAYVKRTLEAWKQPVQGGAQ